MTNNTFKYVSRLSLLALAMASANVAAAATAIGGDKMTTKIFWDKF